MVKYDYSWFKGYVKWVIGFGMSKNGLKCKLRLCEDEDLRIDRNNCFSFYSIKL